MNTRGRLTILAIVAVSLGASVFAWTIKYYQGNRAHVYLGTENVQRIARSDFVRLGLLESRTDETQGAIGDSESSVLIGEREYQITSFETVSERVGLIHLRHALRQNASYDWEYQIPISTEAISAWRFLLEFGEAPNVTRIVISADLTQLALLPDGNVLNCAPISDGMEAVLLENTSHTGG